MKKNVRNIFFALASGFVLASCTTLQNVALDAVATTMSGADKKAKPSKQKKDAPDPMKAVMGEDDTVLISDFIPVTLKAYEIVQAANPSHQGLSVMCGQLNVMYANAFVQTPADAIGVKDFDRKHREYLRAKSHYLKGRNYVLDVFEKRFPGFRAAFFDGRDEDVKKFLEKCSRKDVNALYWCAAGNLGAFSLDPLNTDLIGTLSCSVALLERAAALDPDYSDGSVWDLLFSFYVSAPPDFGGDAERGLFCHEEAMRVSQGKSAGIYISYAQGWCVPNGDGKGFRENLEKALSFNPDDNPDTKLMTVIMQEKARRLLDSYDEFFVDWD